MNCRFGPGWKSGATTLRIAYGLAAGPPGLRPPAVPGATCTNKANSRRVGRARGVRRAVLCKQTQFRGVAGAPRSSGLGRPSGRLCETNPIRGDATWDSAPRGVGHRRSCETKPVSRLRIADFGPGSQSGVTTLRIRDRTGVVRAKQSQFGPAPSCHRGGMTPNKPNSSLGLLPVGRNVRNKANLHPPRGIAGPSGAPNAIHRVWEPDPPCTWVRLRQTNPILPGYPACRAPGRGKRAKQSQFGGQSCRTNPICRVGSGPGGRNVQNEPNSGRPVDRIQGWRAKQTQFRPPGRRDEYGLGHCTAAVAPVLRWARCLTAREQMNIVQGYQTCCGVGRPQDWSRHETT